MNKAYELNNGYSVSKCDFYDGYNMNVRWCIYSPDGTLYMSCASYKEAYETASNLVSEQF